VSALLHRDAVCLPEVSPRIFVDGFDSLLEDSINKSNVLLAIKLYLNMKIKKKRQPGFKD
jgi:hypothetical protein